jgi:ribosomal protein S12 methylthiotransferase accessory factor
MLKTLDPVNGLAQGWQVVPPQPPAPPLWSLWVDIGGLAARGQTAGEYPVHTVGAYGVSRTDTITRAAGEAVERFALFPSENGPPTVTALAGELESIVDFAGSGLGDPSAGGRLLRWYQGQWLDSGRPVWVPAGLVDYPADEPCFDPTPSGAASGPDWEFAVRGGLLEWIERDAVGVAWAADATLGEFDVEAEIAAAPPSPDWRHLARLYRAARRQGLRPRLLRVPVLPGLHCVLAAVVDEPDLAAVGAKAHEDLGRALLVALQEALQVREALTKLRGLWETVVAPEVVRDDMDRARLWLSETAVTELERRLRQVTSVRPGSPSRPPYTLIELVAAVTADGGRAAAVDLTARLPEAHRAMGWRAVKVIVAGYQPLRMDEACQFTWQHKRIAAAATKPVGYFPHPLI